MLAEGFVKRDAHESLARLQKDFPVLVITGPGQAGKTTLARNSFPEKPYVTLEDPDQLDFARTDPQRFLAQYPDGAIVDEVQRCPELFPCLQGRVDSHQMPGEFILIASQQFSFRLQDTQCLSGRMAILHLLPFSSSELRSFGASAHSLEREMFRGFYPPVHDRLVVPANWYADYVQTYVERDVQRLLRVKDVHDFRLLLKLCAARVGKSINLSNIGNDAGVSHNTIREWLSVLEASYMIFQLPPHSSNFGKRLNRSPKLYFYDTGLLCWLLGIRSSDQLATHALRGVIFKNYVIAELAKQYYARGEKPPFYFWRDQSGLEIDLIIERAGKLLPVEIKSGQTLTDDFFTGLNRWMTLAGKEARDPTLIYGGHENQQRTGINVLGWQHVEKLFTA